ncbi:MAG: hypothetical protein K8R87_00320 [Verrucomicrobia bacterium]|nr:hypothetical protein [Verrucomicrobiota bacterium]
MKEIIRNILRGIGLIAAILIGSIPFLASFLCGIVIRRHWIAYVVGFVISTVITIYSAAHPETFRFGSTDLRIHDGLFIAGVPSTLANVAKNLFFAYVGVSTGLAFRQGFRQEEIEHAAFTCRKNEK